MDETVSTLIGVLLSVTASKYAPAAGGATRSAYEPSPRSRATAAAGASRLSRRRRNPATYDTRVTYVIRHRCLLTLYQL
jgi:hypothetical protein